MKPITGSDISKAFETLGVLAPFMAAAIAVFAITGCGDKQETPEPEVIQEEVPEAPAEKSDEVTEEPAEPSDNSYGSILKSLNVDDLDLNKVSVGDLVSSNKVTLVNYWGTFCGPCIMEMPDLEALYQKYKDQGFLIIGMTTDLQNQDGSYIEGNFAEGKNIVADTGVTYPIVVSPVEFSIYSGISAVPTSVLVDENGNPLMDPVLGVKPAEFWDSVISEALAGEQ